MTDPTDIVERLESVRLRAALEAIDSYSWLPCDASADYRHRWHTLLDIAAKALADD